MVGWVGRHGKSLLINDVHAEPRYVNLYPDQVPTQSELSVPIRVGGEVVGVLDVQSPQLLVKRPKAHISVCIALEEDTVLFEFHDDGPGYPEEVLRLERHNVGLYLIQTMVRDDLRGELSLHNDHGAVTTVRFKTKDPSGSRNPKGLRKERSRR